MTTYFNEEANNNFWNSSCGFETNLPFNVFFVCICICIVSKALQIISCLGFPPVQGGQDIYLHVQYLYFLVSLDLSVGFFVF